jgi:hypothetical protein
MRLEHGAEPAALRLREPQMRRALPGRGEAGQRLVAGDAAGGDLHDRLEDGDDRRRGRQHGLDLAPLLDQRQRDHVARVVDADAIAARALRPVQRAVRGLQQLRDRRGVGREGGDAGRAGKCRAGNHEPRQRGAAALRDRGRRLRVGPRKEDRELLAADTRDEAGLTDGPRQRRRRRLQDLVALRVAEGVVEQLEVVEVEHDDAGLGAGGDRRGELLLEGAVVAQPGQRVRGRERLEVGALPREPPQGEPEPQHDGQQREPDQGDGERVKVDERLVTDERERGHGERDRQDRARARHVAPARPRAHRRDGEQRRPGDVAEVGERAGSPALPGLGDDVDAVADGDQREPGGEREPGVESPAAGAPQGDGEAREHEVGQRVGEARGALPAGAGHGFGDGRQQEDRGHGGYGRASDRGIEPEAGGDLHVARPHQTHHRGEAQRVQRQPQRVGAGGKADLAARREVEVVDDAAAGVEHEADADQAPGRALGRDDARPRETRAAACEEDHGQSPGRDDVCEPLDSPG